MELVNAKGLKEVRTAISVDSIGDSFKTGLKQAQLRQEVTVLYPSAQIDNEFKDSLYSAAQLGVEETEHTHVRVTWIPVSERTKVSQVAKDLAGFPNATIQKILSHAPIISKSQKNVIENGLTGDAFDDFVEKHGLDKKEWDAECSKVLLNLIADRQMVRYGENNDQGKDADEPILFNGRVQYSENNFCKEYRPDIDLRGEEKQSIESMNIAEVEATNKAKAKA